MVFGERIDAIEESVNKIKHLFPIVHLTQWPINDLPHLEKLEESFVAEGFEGVILRWALSPYKLDRSTLKERYMLKLKRFSDSEAKIIGFEELLRNDNEATIDERGLTVRSSHKDNKRPGNTLGKLRVQDLTRPEWQFAVGSGFDSALRDQIWQNQDSFLHKVIKFKYLEVGTLDLPRHPVFIAFRHEDDL
jgi:DNA ligase-1